MPRRLSNPEWVQFQNDIDVSSLGLPPWGAVIQWGSQYILAFICPDDRSYWCQTFGIGCPGVDPVSLCQPGELMLTDVSDRADLLRNIPGTYDASQGVWWYQLPREGMAQFLTVAKTTLQATGQIVRTIAEEAGAAAGAATKPILENLAVPLIVIGLVLAYMYLPSRN